MKPPRHIIYGLIDPETKELRYVGYSSESDQRLRNHHKLANLKAKTHKNHWISSLVAKNLRAGMIVIEEHSTAEALPSAEIEMIAYFKSIGCNLTNGTNGGDGVSMTPETRAKISEALTGIKRTEEHKEKVRQANIGKTYSDETKRKVSVATKGANNPFFGKRHSIEAIEKNRQAHIGKKPTAEQRAKMSECHKGNKSTTGLTWKLVNGKRTYSPKP